MQVEASPVSSSELEAAIEPIRALEENVARVLRGKPEVIRLAVVALIARGHVLIEDVPGVGKTTLAQALARSLDVSFQRIQFTSDLLPADVIGVSVFRKQSEEFEFVPGPLFSNVVLADEINRASPKTQSALLEAMSERRVSHERKRYVLAEPFIVLATQNPHEYIGTFPLPESQLDRFLMALHIGYPPAADERKLLRSGGAERALQELRPVLTPEELGEMQARASEVVVADQLTDYILDLVKATRESAEFVLGASTRAAQGLFRTTQAMALCQGRMFATPDDVQKVALAVLGHRVVLRQGGGLEAGRQAIERLVAERVVPL
jgi:MoxR-like ATPase